MGYVTPSTLVYQDLQNSGGVLYTTPDLEACIIGPAYNVVEYVPGSTSSQIQTAAKSTTSTLGTISVGSKTLTVESTVGISKGDTILVAGAGVSGATLQAAVVDVVGNIVTLDTAASTAVIGASVSESGSISNSTVDNSFLISSSKPGQIVDVDSVQVWLNNVKVETLVGSFTAVAGSASISTYLPTGLTGNISSGSSDLTLSATNGLVIGDSIKVVGAGASGADLIAVIKEVAALVVTLDIAASTTVGSAAVTKVAPQNINDLTNTLRVEPGDSIIVSYTDTTSTLKSFTSSVRDLTTSSGYNGTISEIRLIDMFPADLQGTNISISIRKSYSNQQLPSVKPSSGLDNYDISNIGVDDSVVIKTDPELAYGRIVSADVYIGYRALRTDLANRVLTINDANDLVGQLGESTDKNPLSLGIEIALANTTGRIKAIAVTSNDLQGYLEALSTAEGERLYFLVPLTQDQSILSAFKAHVEQMSLPENAGWRVAIVNTAMPLTQDIGQYSKDYVNSNEGNNTITISSGKYVLTSSNSTFISDGISAGDLINITASTPSSQVGAHKVLEVVSNQQLVISATATATAVSFYVSRTLTRSQTAKAVAGVATTLNSKRVWLVQPDIVGVSVNGITKYLPGYYLCCGLAGMGAGFPVQQGFTNIGVAGITDLKHSNFYFSREDLGTMAEVGVCIFAQETQGSIPYCRHELTTDVSVLEYREMLVVKNWDFLSYFYRDKVKSFIGVWNITPDTINVVRQTLVASSELAKSKKLPKIGPPLLGYSITSLTQNSYNKDNLDCYMKIAVVYPLNYLNLHLVI